MNRPDRLLSAEELQFIERVVANEFPRENGWIDLGPVIQFTIGLTMKFVAEAWQRRLGSEEDGRSSLDQAPDWPV